MKKSNLLKSKSSNFPLGNKKGAWGQAPTLLDWLAYIVLIMVIILAMIIFSIESAKLEEGARVVSVNQEKGYLMLNMLRSSSINGSDNIAELISKWYISGSDEDESRLKNSTSRIINFVYEGNHDWEMEVGNEKIGTVGLERKISGAIKRNAKEDISMSIPISYNPDELTVEIKLKVYLAAVKEGSWCWNIASDACTIDDKLCRCDWAGYYPVWTRCDLCSKGCDYSNGVCKGKNVVIEGERCYDLRKERCTEDEKLCKCDGFSWKNCQICSNGCDQEKNKCK